MTAPEHTAPPGWYPDPDGTPGLVRWWTGAGWSDVTTPAGPGVAVQQPAGQSPPRPPQQPPAGVDVFASPPPRRGGRYGLLIGLGAVAVVVLLVIGVVVTRAARNPRPEADLPLPTTLPGQTFAPGTVRIVDEDSGISYPYLGPGWYEYDLGMQRETTAVAGQYFTTQERVPEGGRFIAQCTSGPVRPGFGWTGPDSMRSTMTALADSVRANYYPAPNELRVLRDEPRTVDGRAAWLYEFQLTWQVAGYEATGERAALLLVDAGRTAAALLYLSIPNTHAELYGVIDRVIADVDVL